MEGASTAKWEDDLPHLLSHLQGDKYAKAENISSRILSIDAQDNDIDVPDDVLKTVYSIHTRLLLAQSKYSEALEYILSCKGVEHIDQLLLLEEAYCLYRLGRFLECKSLIQGKLSSNVNKKGDGSCKDPSDLGLMHLLAQCHYRLHETDAATNMYNDIHDLLIQENEDMDETLTNSLAVLLSNHSIAIKPSSQLNIETSNSKMLHASKDTISEYQADKEDLHCYELMYNYATYMLLKSSSIREKKQALEYLLQAEQDCTALDEDAKSIQGNIALAKLLMGDEIGATRSFLELIIALKGQNVAGDSGASSAQSILAAAENNITVLNSKRDFSVFDLMKRLPDVSLDGENLSSKGKMTPHQVRTMLYNRSILLVMMDKVSDCKQLLQGLKESLSTSWNNEQAQGSCADKKQTKRGSDLMNVPAAPTCSDVETTLWLSRIAMVESELLYKQNNTTESLNALEEAIDKVSSAIRDSSSREEVTSLEAAYAELVLFKVEHNMKQDIDKSSKLSAFISTLEGLPESIRSRPATMATLTALYNASDNDDKAYALLSKVAENGVQKSLADFKLRQGLYEDAASLYASMLESNNEIIAEDELLECKAGYIKALSHFDIDKALEESSTLNWHDHDIEGDLDGEVLEKMDIPRLGKSKASSKGGGRIERLIGTHHVSNADESRKKKQNKESVMRKRANKRALYLKEQQEKGNFNPDRPTKPDPERWIPKNQRSYSKRGRKGRQKFVGAQGVGSGAGKDALKLDAAARAAARAEGKDLFGSNPSTAHLSVSSNGIAGKSVRRR